MKQTLLIAVIIAFLTACTDPVAQEKKLYIEVTDLHNKAMAANKRMLQNKVPMENLLNQNLQAAAKDSALNINRSIVVADDAMAAWMKLLKTNYTTKNTGDYVDFLTEQKKQILIIDSLTKAATLTSANFLIKHKN